MISPPNLATWLVRSSLLAFPREFRERFADSMLETFESRFREAGGRASNVLAATIVNLIAEGLRERYRPSFGPTKPRRPEVTTSQKTNPRKSTMTTWLSLLTKEARFTLRSLFARPAFTALTLSTLALGAGANTTIFSVVHGVLLRPLPYHEPEAIITVHANWSGPEAGIGSMSYPDLADLERESSAIKSLVGVNTSSVTLTGLGTPRVVPVARLTKGLMETFRVTPHLGRDLHAEEFGSEGAAVVIISHAFWQAQFAGSAAVLGSTILLSGTPYQIVGVAPPAFDYPVGMSLWIPRKLDLEGCGRGCHTMVGVGRLASGRSLEEARVEIAGIAGNLAAAYPDTNTNKSFLVRSLRDQMVGDVRPGLLILLGAVGLVLLIACANVANLLLVRAANRTEEIAVRTAIGASRGQLMAQSLVESSLLATLGGLLGLALAAVSLHLLPRLAAEIPRAETITIDGNVLAFTLVTVVVVTFLFGTAPAFALARSSLRSGLGPTGVSGETRGRRRFRNLLLATEVALSALLLVGAGLLLRSFTALQRVDVGFDARNLVRFSLLLPEVRYDGLPEIRNFYRQLEERVRLLPGVVSAGSVWGPPLGRGNATGTVLVSGRPEPPPELEREASVHAVGPGWLETMRIPLLRGRGLEPKDDEEGSEPVALVNATFVRENFPGEDPLGKEVGVSVSLGFGSPDWRIVGIVGDVRSRALNRDPEAQIYMPHGRFGPGDMTVTLRTEPGAPSPLPAVRAIVEEMDAEVPLFRIETIEEAVTRHVGPARFYLFLIAVFAGLAAVLAAVGLYGVVAESASKRTREIGLRVALGAGRRGITSLVLRQGMLPALVGLGVGLIGAFFGGRVMNTILYQVAPRDPWIFGSTSLLLLMVALVATLVPARRASRIDPARALRSE